MTFTEKPVTILQAQWLAAAIIVHFSDDVSACFSGEFLLQHRGAFPLPDAPIEEIP